MKKLFLILFAVSFNTFADVEVYFTEDSTVNFARDSFYKEFKNLTEENYSMNGSIDRELFATAHPPAEKDFKNRKIQIPQNISQMIKPIQRDLEVKAKEQALIVDCKPHTSQFVTNCGIYRYSRSKQRVDASSVRYFSVEVDKPQKWVSPLLTNFKKQIEQEDERKEAKLMQEYISSITQESNKTDESDSIIAFGVKQRSINSSNLNGPYIEYAKGKKGFYSLIAISQYKSDRDLSAESLEVGARNLSNEINKLRWEISYRAHLDNINVQKDQETLFGLSLSLGFNANLDGKGNTLLHGSYGLRRSTKLSDQNDTLSRNFNEEVLSLNIQRLF